MERRRELAHATVRGAVAAMSMSGFRGLTTRLGLLETTPPELIGDEYSPSTLRRLPDEQREAIVILMHWLYGAMGGTVFGSLPDRLRLSPWSGPAFGVVLWLAFEWGVVPVLGLRYRLPRSMRQRIGLAADHLLYGLVLTEFRSTPRH